MKLIISLLPLTFLNLMSIAVQHQAHLNDHHLNGHINLQLSPPDLGQLPASAVCLMQSHSPSYNTKGYIRFDQIRSNEHDQSGNIGTAGHAITKISGRLEGLTPNGRHAFHIHELGDLTDPSNGCLSTAAHYNPFGQTHGGPDSCHSHLGDLGNLQADQNGVAEFNFIENKIHIVGHLSIIGRACVVHLYHDDLGLGGTEESLKTGSAGPRISCGVVGRASPLRVDKV